MPRKGQSQDIASTQRARQWDFIVFSLDGPVVAALTVLDDPSTLQGG
jgi:hypothetical protein